MRWILCRAFLGAALPPAALTAAAVVGVAGLLLAVQALALAAVLPSLWGTAIIFLGFLPAALAVALPVAVLAGVTAAGRSWQEGGEARALATAGLPTRALLPALLLIGVAAGTFEATLTHGLEPFGRSAVRQALIDSLRGLQLRPGQPLVIGDVLLHARSVEAGVMGELFIAADDRVLSASRGTVGEDGLLHLQQGSVYDLGAATPWQMTFARAELALPLPTPRLELVERSDASLRALITRTEADHRTADVERMILYERTALPLSLPLLAFLGLPLGMRGVTPAAAAVGVTLGWWSLTRLCDQSVGDLGPLLAAGLPWGALALAAALAWMTWSAR